jgi:hypothetical protein
MTKAATDVVCLDTPKDTRPMLSEFVKSFAQTVAEYHCRLVHRSISRPIGGKYKCWHCLREFETNW